MALPTPRLTIAGATPSEVTTLVAAHAVIPEAQQRVNEAYLTSVDTAGLTNHLNVRRAANGLAAEPCPEVEKALAAYLHLPA